MTERSQHGILPPGIHEMNMEEIGRLFGNVPKPQYRLRLFETFQKYVERLQTLHIGIALLVDGSFVMPCIEKPADIDVALVMPKEWRNPVAKIPPEQYNVLSPVRVEEEFTGLHLFVVAENSPQYHGWVHWFSKIKGDWRIMFDIPHNVSKGLIKVTL
jgi:hypothetical protein